MIEHRFLRDPGPYAAFNAASMADTDPALGPSYAWVWNDRLSCEEIDSQLFAMKEGGIRSVYIIAEPSDFRPGIMETYLKPDYLTEEYWEFFRYAMEKARSLGMVMWLYDEGGWPSGSACGKIAVAHPQLSSCILDHEIFCADTDSSLPEDTVALFDGDMPVADGVPGKPLVRYFSRRLPADGWSPAYTNLLEQKTVDVFLSMTHEACRSECGNLFGTFMPFCFTDEPAVRQVPWAHDAAEDFLAKKGYDIRQFLPLLFRPAKTDNEKQIRIDWYDWWSRRFADTYLGSLRRLTADGALYLLWNEGFSEIRPKSHFPNKACLRRLIL